jgi:hypothetical protein
MKRAILSGKAEVVQREFQKRAARFFESAQPARLGRLQISPNQVAGQTDMI